MTREEIKYKLKTEGYCHFHISDFDEKYEEGFGSDPVAHGQRSKIKPLSRYAAQDTFVLRQLEGMQIDPLKLPKNQSGKPGIKSKIREASLSQKQLFAGSTVFNRTWERLAANGEIAYQK